MFGYKTERQKIRSKSSAEGSTTALLHWQLLSEFPGFESKATKNMFPQNRDRSVVVAQLLERSVSILPRGRRFESSNWPNLYWKKVYCQLSLKDGNKENRSRKWSYFLIKPGSNKAQDQSTEKRIQKGWKEIKREHGRKKVERINWRCFNNRDQLENDETKKESQLLLKGWNCEL